MENRGSHMYIDGTSALELSRSGDAPRERQRLIRVDFRNEQHARQSRARGSFDAGSSRKAARSSARCLASGAHRDAARAFKALGIDEVRGELKTGSLAGKAACEVPAGSVAAFCAALLLFSLAVLFL